MRRYKDISEGIRLRMLRVIEQDNSSEGSEFKRKQAARLELNEHYVCAAANVANIYEIISFCKTYGCTADYILGLSDSPYVIGG